MLCVNTATVCCFGVVGGASVCVCVCVCVCICIYNVFHTCSLSLKSSWAFLYGVMCQWEQESIFRDICTSSFHTQDLVTFQEKCLYGCVVNESSNIAGTSTSNPSTAICWTVPCPIYPGLAMACVERHKREMFLNGAACMNSDKSLAVPERLSQ